MGMIQPISGQISGTAQPLPAAGAGGTPRVRQSENGPQDRSPVPAADEYVPEEKREPAGLYWLGRDGNGQPKLYFDGPAQAASAPGRQGEDPSAGGPARDEGADRKAPGKKAETCTCSTDQVDREIEGLKKRREQLEQQVSTQTDEVKRGELERKLTQVERELGQKDNDAYRRQNAVFS